IQLNNANRHVHDLLQALQKSLTKPHMWSWAISLPSSRHTLSLHSSTQHHLHFHHCANENFPNA
ncbi:MAG: hypothetical protein ACRC9V_01770, partial [Aeromonas sp.]